MLNQETAKAARTDSGYILRAPRRMRVADAVAQYMRVPMGAGNSVPWDPLVAPYVIEPMNCLASREYDAVIFVGPARTGKTIGLIDGWVIYNVICDPADMLIIQMTEEKAREHSKKRLARTFRVSPEVVSRLSPNKNDNNVYDRTFLAGNYLKIGWPSVNIMSSSDYKCVALTDYDRFPEDIDGEGDAFSLASKRTTTFMSSGMTLVESSPGRDVKDVKWRRTSPHEAPPTTGILSLYNRGDRRRWYWPCPHCGEYFQPCGDVVAGFRDIADPVLASEAAYIQCPSCSGRIMPEQKRELNGRGVWFLKRLTAPTITSGGSPPVFSLTSDGKLTAKNADISGSVNANSGTLNNVTINENCQIKGKLSANQIEGDIVKTVSKSFPRTNSYASGTITVRISDDQKFDRQVMIPPVLFRGGKHENFNSNNQQSYWYSTCRLRVTRNGQEIFNQSTTDAQGVFSSVIDMPAGQGTLTLTFTVSSSGANNWTPTTSISDLLVVVMKKSTAGISIS
ncbi:TPA: hypothetical protein JLE21_000482 [Escherichia coli]|nr:hypothetical protein [Escherichia coli]HAW7345262.1 hypothetical protein [Escherichia coli]